MQVTAPVVAGSGMNAFEPLPSDNSSDKRKLPVTGSTAFQAWLDEEEEEWRIGQRLAATCPAEFICPISLDIMMEPVILVWQQHLVQHEIAYMDKQQCCVLICSCCCCTQILHIQIKLLHAGRDWDDI